MVLAVSPWAKLVRLRALDAFRPSVEPSPTRLEEVFELWAPKSLSCEFGRRVSFPGASARRLRFTRLELDFDRRGALPLSGRVQWGRLSGCRSAFLWLGPLFDAAVCDSVLIVAGEMQFPSPPFRRFRSLHRASPDGFCSLDTTRRQEPRYWSRTSSFVKERATKLEVRDTVSCLASSAG